ncbi:MAG: EFR1 family ferrodoxin [Eubacterium sp.]|nr:EFR1 family ferrodoxin [Eubacterium sp.]
MTGVYFSGTGNSKYILEVFLKAYDKGKKPHSELFAIEEAGAAEAIRGNQEIVFSYPVQFSNIPKIVRDFVVCNQNLWKQKKIFIIATMGLFSGDGAGVLGRLLEKYGAEITGGLHVKMPDSIADEKVLKRTVAANQRLAAHAAGKAKRAARALKAGRPPKDGLGWISHMTGLLGQRLWFYHKVKNYSDGLKINTAACVGCGICTVLCPMDNLKLVKGKATASGRCTMCYRCIQNCPKQALTLLGKRVVRQGTIETYL